MSDENQPPRPPIDGGQMPPPPSVDKDRNYITRDLEVLLDRAVLDLVDRVAEARKIGRRAAVPLVVQILRIIEIQPKDQPKEPTILRAEDDE